MIFIDSNVPLFLVGAAHPNKDRAVRTLERCINQRERLVTDVEVFEEILDHYAALDRRDAVQPAFGALLDVVDEVLDVPLSEIQRAKELVLAHRALTARDAVHAAVMERHGIKRIFSFDPGFDEVPGLQRLSSPAGVEG